MSDGLVARRFGAKVYFQEDVSGFELESCIGIFQRWIQEGALDELMIDVADYRHVPRGSGVMLICHAAHYALDELDGRMGLRFEAKRDELADPVARIGRAAASALQAARLLERGVGGGAPVAFDGRTVRVFVQDRLLAPNCEETFAALRPALQQVAHTLYGAGGQLERIEGDPRQALSARLSASEADAPDLEGLLARAQPYRPLQR